MLIQTPVPAPDPSAISRAVLAVRGKTPVTIGDIAKVTEARALRSGDALVMGKPGVMLSLASQYGANTLETTRALEVALAQLKPALQAQGIWFQLLSIAEQNAAMRRRRDSGRRRAIGFARRVRRSRRPAPT